MVKILGFVALLLAPSLAVGADYRCVVEHKYAANVIVPKDHLEKTGPTVLISDNGDSAIIARCSYVESLKKVTCDKYTVDKIEVDQNVHIKKFYVFQSQFDVQIFKDLAFLENNGRGGVAYGKCVLVSP